MAHTAAGLRGTLRDEPRLINVVSFVEPHARRESVQIVQPNQQSKEQYPAQRSPRQQPTRLERDLIPPPEASEEGRPAALEKWAQPQW